MEERPSWITGGDLFAQQSQKVFPVGFEPTLRVRVRVRVRWETNSGATTPLRRMPESSSAFLASLKPPVSR